MKTQRTFLLKLFAFSLTGCLAAALASVSTAWAHPQLRTVRVSVSSTGTQGNGISGDGALAAYGRFVVFTSAASNLVGGDTNGVDDIFVHDLKTRKTKRVSVSSAGIEGNGRSRTPFISDNGRYVAFQSEANNLVADDDNGVEDNFVRDLQTGVTWRFCGFDPFTGCDSDYYHYELYGLSGNGRFIMSTFMPIDDFGDLLVGNLKTGEISHVGGAPPFLQSALPSLSTDGRYIAYMDEYLFNENCLVHGDADGTSPATSIKVMDIKTGVSHCLEYQNPYHLGGTALSADGRFVAYVNSGVGLFVRNTYLNGSTQPVSYTIKGSDPDLTADGRFVAFTSRVSDLVKRDTNGTFDVFVRDLKAGVTHRVSVNSAGKEGNKDSYDASISANGQLVAFTADADNLVKGDTNGKQDIFVHFCRR